MARKQSFDDWMKQNAGTSGANSSEKSYSNNTGGDSFNNWMQQNTTVNPIKQIARQTTSPTTTRKTSTTTQKNRYGFKESRMDDVVSTSKSTQRQQNNTKTMQMFSTWANSVDRYYKGGGDQNTANMLKSHAKTLENYLKNYGNDFDEPTRKSMQSVLDNGMKMLGTKQKQLYDFSDLNTRAKLNTTIDQRKQKDPVQLLSERAKVSTAVDQAKKNRWNEYEANQQAEQNKARENSASYLYNLTNNISRINGDTDFSSLTKDDAQTLLDRLEAQKKTYLDAYNNRKYTGSPFSDEETANFNLTYSTAQGYDTAINKLKKQIEKEEKFESYEALRNNPDFAQWSKFTDTDTYKANKDKDPFDLRDKNGKLDLSNLVSGTSDKYGSLGEDLLYYAVNGDKEAVKELYTRNNINTSDAQRMISPSDASKYENIQYMTDDEKSMFNYIYHTQGAKAAEEYFDFIESKLNFRFTTVFNEGVQQWAENNPVGSSFVTVIAKPLETTSYINQAMDYILNGQVDENAPYNMPVQGVVNARNTVANMAAEKWGAPGSFLYQTGMSMADSMYTALISGATFGSAAGEAVRFAENLTLAIMGTEAAAETVVNMKQQGYDDNKSFTLGTLAGAAEIVTEKVSLDSLLDTLGKGRGSFTAVIKQILAEGSEEGASDVLNWIADSLYDTFSGTNQSEFKEAVREYKRQGLNEKDATWRVILGRAKELGLDVLGGGLSGGFMGGGAIAYNNLNQIYTGYTGATLDGENRVDTDYANELITAGLQLDRNTSANRSASKLAEKLNKGENITRAEAALQYYRNVQGQIRYADREGIDFDEAVSRLNEMAEQMNEPEGAITSDRNDAVSTAETISNMQNEETAEETVSEETTEEKLTKVAENTFEDTLRNETIAAQDAFNNRSEQAQTRTEPSQIRAESNEARNSSPELRVLRETRSAQQIERDVDNIFKLADILDKDGRKAFSTALLRMYDQAAETIPAGTYVSVMQKYYQAGNTDLEYEEVTHPMSEYLTEEMKKAAYLAGEADQMKRLEEAARLKLQSAEETTVFDKDLNGNAFVKATSDSVGVVDNEVVRSITSPALREQITQANDAAKRLGLQITYERSSKTFNGNITGNKMVIYLDNAQNSLRAVMGHETLHYIKSQSETAYEEFKSAVLGAMPQEEFDALVDKTIEGYKQNNMRIERIDAEEEVIADYAGTLFENRDVLDKFINQNITEGKKTVLERLHGVAKRFLNKLKGSKNVEMVDNVQHAVDVLAKALKDVADMDKTVTTEELKNSLKESGNNQLRIKEQIEAHLDELSKMNIVKEINTVGVDYNDNATYKSKALEAAKKAGYKVDRQNFGVILLGQDELSTGFRYTNNLAEKIAYQAIPNVLKKGIVISPASEHKNRGYDSATIAAPISIDGLRVNMAVTVKITNKMRYKVHRIATMEGEKVDIKNAVPTLQRGVTENSSLANAIGTAKENITQELNSGNTKFSMKSAVEETDTLIALHNLTAEKLEKSIELGGMPMPSIAVTRADIPHTNFGDITLVMSKETIDPEADSRNTVYSADAWTPVFPNVEYEADKKAKAKINDQYYSIYRKYGRDIADPLYNAANDLESMLARYEGEKGLVEHYKNDVQMMNFYLATQGNPISTVTKTTEDRMSDGSIEMANNVSEIMGEDKIKEISELGLKRVAWLRENADYLANTVRQLLTEKYNFTEEDANNIIDRNTTRELYLTFIAPAVRVNNGNTVITRTEADTEATNNAIKAAVNKDEYERWLNDLFKDVVKDTGVYNNKDYYTPSGNRRSFRQTHNPVTLTGIVNAMRSQNNGNTKNVSGFYGIKTLRGGVAKRFSSIAEMHDMENRLQNLSQEEADQLNDALSTRLTEILGKIYDAGTYGRNDNSFMRMDSIGHILEEIAENPPYTIDRIVKTLKGYGYNINNGTAQDIKELLFDVDQMPRYIFEAKPERAVGFNEVLAAVVPEGTDTKLVEKMQNAGIQNVITYQPSNTEDRLAKVNSIEGAKFSLKNIDEKVLAEYIKENYQVKEQEAKYAAEQLRFIVDVSSGAISIRDVGKGGDPNIYDGNDRGRSERKSESKSGIVHISGRYSDLSIRNEETNGQTRTIALGISTEFVRKGFIDFRGIKLSKNRQEAATQLATHAMLLRNPQYETHRLFYLKGNEIVGSEAVTSYLVNGSYISRDKKGSVTSKTDVFEAIKDRMKRLGADGYYSLHNHPSGDIIESSEDMNAARELWHTVPGYRGSIIIDHNKFNYLSPHNGDIEPNRQTITEKTESVDFHEKVIDHPLLYDSISNANDLALVAAKIVHDDNYSVVAYANKDGIRAIQEVDNRFAKSKDFANYVANRKLEFGSSNAFLISTDEDLFYNEGFDGYKRNIFRDVIKVNSFGLAQGKSLNEAGVKPKPEYGINGKIYDKAFRVGDNNSRYSMKFVEEEDVSKLEKGNEILQKENTRLAERTNTQKETIKVLTEQRSELEKEKNELIKTIKEQNKTIENYKQQFKRTERAIDPKAFKREFKKIIKDFSGTINADDYFNSFYEVANEFQKDPENTWGDLNAKAIEIANKIVETAQEFQEFGPAHEVRQYLKDKKIPVSAKIKADIPDYNALRQSYMGKLTLTTQPTGQTMEELYEELKPFGENMFPDTTSPTEMLFNIMEAVSTDDRIFANPYDSDRAAAIDCVTNALLTQAMEPKFNKLTYADKTAKVIEREQKKYDQMKHNNKVYYEQIVENMLRDRETSINEVKKYYQNKEAQRRDAREYSEASQVLLKMAKRLNKLSSKTTEFNQAKIKEALGTLDLVSTGITGRKISDLVGMKMDYDNRIKNDPDYIPDKRTENELTRLADEQINGKPTLLKMFSKQSDAAKYKAEYLKDHPGEKVSISHVEDTYQVMKYENRMTLEDIISMTNILRNIEEEISNHDRTLETADRRDIWQQGSDSIDAIEKSAGKSGFSLGNKITTGTLRPSTEMLRIVGYDRNAPLYQRYLDLEKGQRTMLDYQRRAYSGYFDRFLNNSKLVNGMTKGRAIEIKGFSIDGSQAHTLKITPDMLMSLYMHSFNNENMRHISEGGVEVPDYALYIKGRYSDAAEKFTKITMQRSYIRKLAADNLTAEELAFCEAAKSYYRNMSRPEINRASELLVGYPVARVENYWRIVTDRKWSGTQFDQLKFDGTITGEGWQKERVYAKNPIVLLGFSEQLKKDVEAHSRYVGMAIPIRNFNKVYGVTRRSFDDQGNATGYESSVQIAIRQKWGEQANDYIAKMMTDIQNPQRTSDEVAKFLGKMRGNYAAAVLNLNASVAIKQSASFPTAAAEIGWEPLFKALATFPKTKGKSSEFISKYSPMMRLRTEGYGNVDLADIKSRNKQMPKALNWIQMIDVGTVRLLWLASEYYVRSNTNLKVGSEEYYQEVGRVHTRVIEATQPNYSALQRPQALRADSDLTRTLMMFKTQPFQNFNILYESIGNWRAASLAYKNNPNVENKQNLATAHKRFAWAVSSQLISSFVFALMQYAWDAFRKKDDKYKDKDGNQTFLTWLKGMGINMASNGAGMIPFGSQLFELGEAFSDVLIKTFSGETFFDAVYYGVDTGASTDLINDLAKTILKLPTALNKVVSGIKGEEDNWPEIIRGLVKIGTDAAQFLGIPAGNIEKTLVASAKTILPKVMGEYYGTYKALDLAQFVNDDKKSEFYKVLQNALNNDEEQYKQIYDEIIENPKFKTAANSAEKNVNTNMRSYLKGIVREAYENDSERFKELEEMVINHEELFSDVDATARESITNWTKDLKESEEQAAVGLTEEDMAAFKQALKDHDEDQNGSYKQEEIYNALKSLALSKEQEELLWEQKVRKGDEKKKTISEFAEEYKEKTEKAEAIAEARQKAGITDSDVEKYEEALKKFDLDGDERNDQDEVYQALQSLALSKSQRETLWSEKYKTKYDDFAEQVQKEADNLAARKKAGITDADIKKYEDALKKYDLDGNERYDQEEVYQALQSLALSKTQKETLWKEKYTTKYDDYAAKLQKQSDNLSARKKAGITDSDVKKYEEALKKYDLDGNGRSSQAEVYQALQSLALSQTQKETLWNEKYKTDFNKYKPKTSTTKKEEPHLDPYVSTNSSVLAGYQYNWDNGVLTVDLKDGRRYTYHVTPEVYQGLQNAESKGSYWSRYIG